MNTQAPGAADADTGKPAPLAGDHDSDGGDIDNTILGDDDGDGDGDGDDDDVIVLPWWQNVWNIVAIVLGVLVLAGGLGFVIGERNATPDPNQVDIGFLQDMRTHHEQAVDMALTYLTLPDIDPTMSLIAKEIAFGQGVDIGRMIQLLRQYGASEANLTDTSMGWMGPAIPTERMPGLATDADLNKLANSSGTDADTLFAQLMIAHHEGGIHMAEYAAEHAGTSQVRKFADSMVKGQKDDIFELQRLLNGS